MDELREITLSDVKEIVGSLINEGVEYVIFGGVALNLHNVYRGTEDVDIYIRNTEENVSRFIRAFSTLSMFKNITYEEVKQLEQEGAFEYGVIKFLGDIGLDVATTMGDSTIDSLESEIIYVDGLPARVITLHQLYKMKSNSYREKDQNDVQEIRRLKGMDLF